MIAFSASEMTRERRSGPATIRSRASWNSDMPIVFLLRRAARIAASLTRLARSAPEKPGDWRATPSTSTPLSSGLPLVWTLRISVRPRMSARAEERGVEDVGPVGGGDNDHVGVGVEAVHLDQDLVEGLLAFVVAAAEAG